VTGFQRCSAGNFTVGHHSRTGREECGQTAVVIDANSRLPPKLRAYPALAVSGSPVLIINRGQVASTGNF